MPVICALPAVICYGNLPLFLDLVTVSDKHKESISYVHHFFLFHISRSWRHICWCLLMRYDLCPHIANLSPLLVDPDKHDWQQSHLDILLEIFVYWWVSYQPHWLLTCFNPLHTRFDEPYLVGLVPCCHLCLGYRFQKSENIVHCVWMMEMGCHMFSGGSFCQWWWCNIVS